jgi:elongation factor Ts
MHIAAAEPLYVAREEVTPEILAHEEEIFRDQALASGKPEQVIDRIVTGKMEKFFSESVLLEQAFVKDPDKSVGELVTEAVAKMGENIKVRRFSRFRLGEGVQKRSDDFAAEVAQQMAG